MRKRRQITGRAHRSLLRHQRTNAVRQHGLELLDDFAANARSAPPQRDDLQRHHQAHDRFGSGRPYPATMRYNEVALQQRGLVGRNSFRRQFSEPGIDTVNRRFRIRRLRNNGRCCLDARPERWIEHDGSTRKHLRQLVEADPRAKQQWLRPGRSCPLHTRRCSGRSPSGRSAPQAARYPRSRDRNICRPRAAGLTEKTQCTRTFPRHPSEAFGNGHPEQRRAHIHGQQERCQRRAAGIAVGSSAMFTPWARNSSTGGFVVSRMK